MSEPYESPPLGASDAGTEDPDPPGQGASRQGSGATRSPWFWLALVLIGFGLLAVGGVLAGALVWYLLRVA